MTDQKLLAKGPMELRFQNQTQPIVNSRWPSCCNSGVQSLCLTLPPNLTNCKVQNQLLTPQSI